MPTEKVHNIQLFAVVASLNLQLLTGCQQMLISQLWVVPLIVGNRKYFSIFFCVCYSSNYLDGISGFKYPISLFCAFLFSLSLKLQVQILVISDSILARCSFCSVQIRLTNNALKNKHCFRSQMMWVNVFICRIIRYFITLQWTWFNIAFYMILKPFFLCFSFFISS